MCSFTSYLKFHFSQYTCLCKQLRFLLKLSQIFGQLYEAIRLCTTDTREARSITRPETAIQACFTTQKRHLLKPASSSLNNAEGQYAGVAIH